jgi:hypothetical protein
MINAKYDKEAEKSPIGTKIRNDKANSGGSSGAFMPVARTRRGP